MPELDGATLMEEVARRHPETLRIILSGYAEEDYIMRTVAPSHQYFAKPCSADEIIMLLERMYALHMALQNAELRKLVAGMQNLPTPSDLYMRLTAEIQNSNSSTRTIAGMISEDIATTAEILRITNSGYFALGSPVHDVFQAIRLLGVETVRALVFSAGIFRSFHSSDPEAEFLNDLDVHCFLVATQARLIAQNLELSEPLRDQAFCAGMLSCVGTLVLLDAYPEKIRAVFSRVLLGEDYGLVEHEVFGASQAEIGAYLLGLWGFSDVVVEAVLYHDRPSDCHYKDHSALSCVHLARAAGPELSVNGTSVRPIKLDEEYLASLGMTEMISEISMELPY